MKEKRNLLSRARKKAEDRKEERSSKDALSKIRNVRSFAPVSLPGLASGFAIRCQLATAVQWSSSLTFQLADQVSLYDALDGVIRIFWAVRSGVGTKTNQCHWQCTSSLNWVLCWHLQSACKATNLMQSSYILGRLFTQAASLAGK